jgi:2-oxoglutarate ferredoxin oxidoreductase subunit alpha
LAGAGEAGQGLQTLEQLLLQILKRSGRHVYSYSEFMSRIRGGINSTEIRISSRPVRSFRRRIDLFVPFHPGAFKHLQERITPRTVILGDSGLIPGDYAAGGYVLLELPLAQLAKDAGGAIMLNMVVVGVMSALLNVERDLVRECTMQSLSQKSSERARTSVEAALNGYDAAHERQLPTRAALPVIGQMDAVKNQLLMNGIDAVGMGALAGGCTFACAYPMSPSTGVLVFLARQAARFGLAVEQVEDEISAVNMAIGAWYAGGRALVTTSGGGFALMVEALSLAGMVESPLVIHVGQRPGPATGLPTRTEQGDLDFALYAGHGEFPRAILAPGTVEEGFALVRHAFDLADSCQVPVLILTDQSYLESNLLVDDLDLSGPPVVHHIVQTESAYRRYAMTPDGISPRGIPGFGAGVVCVDSDEHDESGHITESAAVRTAMMEKRMQKLSALVAACRPPTLYGPENYRCLIVGWGSTQAVVCEAMEAMGRDDIAFLHFSQVYPLHGSTAGMLLRAEKRIIIENNFSGQFARLIKQETGLDFHERILKYDGLPFMLEDLISRLESIV